MKTLFPVQELSRDVLCAAIRKHGAALDSSCTGSGKTLKAVEVARALGIPATVVCPKVVVPAWQNAFREQGVPVEVVCNYEKLRNGNTPWLSKQGRSFRWNLPEGSLVIFDEAHKTKGKTSQNARMLTAARDQGFKLLMLSATAAEDPTELRAIGHALGLHGLKDFYRWAMRQGCSLDPWNQLRFPLKSRPKLAGLHNEIYPEHGHKVSRADMGDLFSVTSVALDPLDFGDDGAIAGVYREMDKELAELSKTVSSDKGASALTAQLRARQQIELMKVPVLAGMIADDVDEGKSVAVFLNFRASMDALAQRLPVDKAHIHGDQTAAERQEAVERFQSDAVPVILCQVSAGGTGVSLHDERGGRPRTSYVSPSYNAKEILQCLGRIDRVGAQSDTTQRVLFAAGTIEEDVARSLRKKTENLEILHRDLDNMTLTYNVSPTVDANQAATTAPEERPAHAKHGPSTLKYKEICPGWKSREGTNRAAETGTRVHEAVEKEDPSLLHDDWDRMLYERCLEALGHIVRKHRMDKPGENHKEITLDIDLGDGLATYGTADRLMVRGNEAVMIDWKTGRGQIDDASVNTQAQAYTLGVFQRFPEVDRVHFWFVIPQRDEVSFHTYTREDVPRITLRLSTVIRRAEAVERVWDARGGMPSDMLNPHSGVCDWCSNQWRCKAVTEKVLDLARKYGTDGLPVPAKVHGSETDNPEDMAALLRLLPVVERWAEGVKSRAKQMVFEEALEIPGFEGKEKAGPRTVSSALAAWEAVKDSMTLEDFLATIGTVSFNDLARHVYDNAPKGAKTKAKNALEAKLSDLGVLEFKPPVKYLQAQR